MMIAMRLTLVALLLAPFALRGTEGKFKYLFMLALVMGVATFSLFFSGLVGVDASVAAVVLMLGVPFSTILAFLFLKDRPGPWRCLGLGIAFAGQAVIAGEPKTASNLGHVGLLIGSAFCWALGNVVAKKLGKVDIFWMTAWMALLASHSLGAYGRARNRTNGNPENGLLDRLVGNDLRRHRKFHRRLWSMVSVDQDLQCHENHAYHSDGTDFRLYRRLVALVRSHRLGENIGRRDHNIWGGHYNVPLEIRAARDRLKGAP